MTVISKVTKYIFFCKVRDKRRATKYRFRVQSLGDGAASTFSGVLEESTSAEQPSQPYKPTHRRLIKMEPGEQLDEAHVKKPGPFYKCELSWKAPKETGGLAIQEYQLQQRIGQEVEIILAVLNSIYFLVLKILNFEFL